jgi:hypothetical protein
VDTAAAPRRRTSSGDDFGAAMVPLRSPRRAESSGVVNSSARTQNRRRRRRLTAGQELPGHMVNFDPVNCNVAADVAQVHKSVSLRVAWPGTFSISFVLFQIQ